MTEVDRITTLSPTSSTDEAMALLLVSGLSGAPVVVDVSDDDATHKILVGVVSSFDFLQREAFEGSLLPMEGSRANVEKYVHAAQKICGQIVQDIMTPANQVRFVRGSKGAFDSLHGNRWFFFRSCQSDYCTNTLLVFLFWRKSGQDCNTGYPHARGGCHYE